MTLRACRRCHTFEDDRCSYGEQRFVTFGLLAGVPVSVVHTENEHEIRVISYRKVTSRDARIFFNEVQPELGSPQGGDQVEHSDRRTPRGRHSSYCARQTPLVTNSKGWPEGCARFARAYGAGDRSHADVRRRITAGGCSSRFRRGRSARRWRTMGRSNADLPLDGRGSREADRVL
ncbi:MAG: BrnT family toxin [Acidobacteriota bacterium]